MKYQGIELQPMQMTLDDDGPSYYLIPAHIVRSAWLAAGLPDPFRRRSTVRKGRGMRWRSHGVHAPSRRTLMQVSRHQRIDTSGLSRIIDILSEANPILEDMP